MSKLQVFLYCFSQIIFLSYEPGLSALLDRASLAPAPPDASLVDPSVLIPLNELKCETLPLSKVRNLSILDEVQVLERF